MLNTSFYGTRDVATGEEFTVFIIKPYDHKTYSNGVEEPLYGRHYSDAMNFDLERRLSHELGVLVMNIFYDYGIKTYWDMGFHQVIPENNPSPMDNRSAAIVVVPKQNAMEPIATLRSTYRSLKHPYLPTEQVDAQTRWPNSEPREVASYPTIQDLSLQVDRESKKNVMTGAQVELKNWVHAKHSALNWVPHLWFSGEIHGLFRIPSRYVSRLGGISQGGAYFLQNGEMPPGFAYHFPFASISDRVVYPDQYLFVGRPAMGALFSRMGFPTHEGTSLNAHGDVQHSGTREQFMKSLTDYHLHRPNADRVRMGFGMEFIKDWNSQNFFKDLIKKNTFAFWNSEITFKWAKEHMFHQFNLRKLDAELPAYRREFSSNAEFPDVRDMIFGAPEAVIREQARVHAKGEWTQTFFSDAPPTRRPYEIKSAAEVCGSLFQ